MVLSLNIATAYFWEQFVTFHLDRTRGVALVPFPELQDSFTSY